MIFKGLVIIWMTMMIVMIGEVNKSLARLDCTITHHCDIGELPDGKNAP